MDQFSNIMTNHMSDLFDDDSINRIHRMTPIKPIVQDDELFPEESKENGLSYFEQTSQKETISEIEGKKESIEIKMKTTTKEEASFDITGIREELNSLKQKIDNILSMLDGKSITPLASPLPLTPAVPKPIIVDSVLTTDEKNDDKILEGVFNGEKMLGSDGKEYSVPPNYASKSKLVEGDIMKLTFAPNGRFIYKQIGPIARKRIIGVLSFDEERQLWNVHHDGKKYKVLTASVTFYKGKPNDEAVVLIPEENECSWCAMENIISK